MNPATRTSPRRGSVLVLVLWIVIILGIIGLSYSAAIRTQMNTFRSSRGRHIAQWAARSGIERAIAELMQTDLKTVTDVSPLLSDQELFMSQPVDEWAYYSLLGTPDEEGNPRFGLVDECSKISVNRASEPMLLGLTGVTTEMAQSLLDWRDSDEEMLTEGGESDYYLSLASPYPAKNAPLESVRELLRIKGWGPVFDAAYPDNAKRYTPPPEEGEEQAATLTNTETSTGQNQNSGEENADPNAAEPVDPGAVATPDPNSGTSTGEELPPQDARLLLDSLTAWSAAPLTNPDGTEKVNISSAGQSELMSGIPGLSREEAEAIIARQRNGGIRSVTELASMPPASSSGNGQDPETPNNQNSRRAFTLERVGEIIDYCTVGNQGKGRGGQAAAVQAGLVNINTAPRQVLLAIPGMTEELADEIISERQGNGALAKPGDLTQLNGLSERQFQQIYPWICTESTRFHVTSQGIDKDSGAVVTVEAVLALDDPMKVTVVYWREF